MKIILVYFLTVLFISCSTAPKRFSKERAVTPATPSQKTLLKKAETDLQKNKIKSAQKTLKQVVLKGPDSDASAEANFLLGQIGYNQRNYKKAYQYFIRLIQSDLSSAKEGLAYYKAARSLEKNGQIDEAIALADSGILRSDISPLYHIQLHQIKVRLHADLNNNVEALRSALFLSQNHKLPNMRNKYRIKAQNIVELRLNKSELQHIASDSDFSSLHPYINYRVGFNYFQNGEFSKAQDKLEDVISASPDSALADNARSLLEQISARSKVDPLTVGVILPLSGKHARIARKALKGLQLGLGVYGQERSRIKLAIIDSEANADSSRKAVQRLVTEDNVIAIVGGLLSKTSSTISAKSNELGVPNITLSQKSKITENGGYIFQNALTSKEQVKAIVKTAMEELGFKNFAILYPNDNYGTEYSNLFWDEVKARGGNITAAQTYDAKETDFNASVKRLVGTFYVEARKDEYKLYLKEWLKDKKSISSRSEPPENLLPPIIDFQALFVPDNTKALGQIAPMLAFHDVDGVTLLGTNLWNNPSLIKRGGRYVEGSVFVDSALSFKKNISQGSFRSSYTKSFSEEPNKFAAQAYDSGLMIRQAIAAGESTRIGLSQYLLKLKSFNGSAGKLTINNHREFNYPLIGLTVNHHKIVPLSEVKKKDAQ